LELSLHDKVQVGLIEHQEHDYSWLDSKKTVYIHEKIREVKLENDFNPIVSDIPFTIRLSHQNEVESTTKSVVDYNPRNFGVGVHFIWEFEKASH
jgi:hypothetical protein